MNQVHPHPDYPMRFSQILICWFCEPWLHHAAPTEGQITRAHTVQARPRSAHDIGLGDHVEILRMWFLFIAGKGSAQCSTKISTNLYYRDFMCSIQYSIQYTVCTPCFRGNDCLGYTGKDRKCSLTTWSDGAPIKHGESSMCIAGNTSLPELFLKRHHGQQNLLPLSSIETHGVLRVLQRFCTCRLNALSRPVWQFLNSPEAGHPVWPTKPTTPSVISCPSISTSFRFPMVSPAFNLYQAWDTLKVFTGASKPAWHDVSLHNDEHLPNTKISHPYAWHHCIICDITSSTRVIKWYSDSIRSFWIPKEPLVTYGGRKAKGWELAHLSKISSIATVAGNQIRSSRSTRTARHGA